MRTIWVNINPWNKDLVTTALEGGADAVMVPAGYSEKVKELGRIQTVCDEGDIQPEKDIAFFTVTSGEDEEEIVRVSREKPVILTMTDWTVIPLENLIAKKADIMPTVTSLEEAKLAFGILEQGVDRVLLQIPDPAELKNALTELRAENLKTSLAEAEILEIRPLGMGDRICVDTCTMMGKGQGMLVGNSSRGLFLVHAESVSNPYVAPRPFRVNAGPPHAYTRVPGGKTRYLSELGAGDAVLLTDYTGKTESAVVGRIKLEKRPLILVKARSGEEMITSILQNAETIRLTNPGGEPASVVTLRPGDKVLCAIEEGGRHFGFQITESITEK